MPSAVRRGGDKPLPVARRDAVVGGERLGCRSSASIAVMPWSDDEVDLRRALPYSPWQRYGRGHATEDEQRAAEPADHEETVVCASVLPAIVRLGLDARNAPEVASSQEPTFTR